MNLVSRRPRILFATPVLHHPPVGGPSLRIENSIKALAQLAELTIYGRLPYSELGGEVAVSFYRQLGYGFHLAPFRPLPPPRKSIAQRLHGALNRRMGSATLTQPSPQEDYGRLLELAAEIKADVIWLGYGNISYPLLQHIKQHSRYPVVLDTDSVWSRFVLRGAPFAATPEARATIEADGRAKEAEELTGTRMADVTTAVSALDAEYYRSLARDPRQVHLFANVIDLEMYSTPPPPAPGLSRPSLFLGGTFWRGSPMENAARWLIGTVLPLVWQTRPTVQLTIVGKGADSILADVQHPAITVYGMVPSVLPFLCHANAALVPLHFESGTRFKILEAGACGIPVVSTTLGAEGLPLDGDHALIADEPADFAAAILQLLNDRLFAKRLAVNLQALVARNYSLPTLVAQGQLILDYLSSRSSIRA